MKRALFTLFFCVSFVLSTPGIAETLTVAVAPNIKYAFDDLQAEFKKETGIDISPVFSSSGKIAAQVRHGAPFDVFMSADMGFPETLYKDGYAAEPPRIYAYGALVLWTMKDLDMGKGVELLKDGTVEKVAVANPRVAPYGREAIKVLKYYRLHEAVEPKLVYGEDVSQTSLYIASRSADIGLTAKSVVVSPEMKGKGKWIEIKKDSYDPIAQGVVILKHGRETSAVAAQRFHDFLFSPKARAIFERYGYTLP